MEQGIKLDNYTNLVDVLIRDESEGNAKHEKVLLLGRTPDHLIKYANFPELNLAIKSSVISKAYFDHGIHKPMLKQLPEIIANPKSIFLSAHSDNRGSVVVLTHEVKGVSPVIIPIRQNQQVGRSNYFNLITSVYGKEGPDPEEKWKQAGLLLWTL